MVTEILLKPVIDAAVSKAFETAIDETIASLTANIRGLDERLAQINSNIEKMLTVNLKSAFTYVTLGLFEQARDKLVEATATDPYAAIAKFWFGLVLNRLGQHERAVKECAEAFLLNPFVALQFFGNAIWSDLMDAEYRWQPWSHRLPNSSAFEHYLGTRKRRWLGGKPPLPASYATLHQLSCSGTHFVLLWDNTSRSWSETVLSSFSLIDGSCAWSRPAGDIKLKFSTPKLVIAELTNGDGYALVDILTGATKTKMSDSYFRTVFSPEDFSMVKEVAFTKSNRSMLYPTVAATVCKARMGKVGLGDTKRVVFEDYHEVEVPFGPAPFGVGATNLWHYEHFAGAYNTPGWDKYWCYAQIELTSQGSQGPSRVLGVSAR